MMAAIIVLPFFAAVFPFCPMFLDLFVLLLFGVNVFIQQEAAHIPNVMVVVMAFWFSGAKIQKALVV